MVKLLHIALYCAIQALHFLLGECLALPDFFFYLIVFLLLGIVSGQDSLSELLGEEDDTFDRGLDRSWDVEPLIFFDEIVDLVNFGHKFPFHSLSRVRAVAGLHACRDTLPHLADERALYAFFRQAHHGHRADIALVLRRAMIHLELLGVHGVVIDALDRYVIRGHVSTFHRRLPTRIVRLHVFLSVTDWLNKSIK